MAENSGSKDRYLEALDIVVNFLKEHEQNLDKSINEFASIIEQMGNIEVLNDKLETLEEKTGNLQKEVTNLIVCLSNAPKEAMSASIEKEESQAYAAPALAPIVFQGGPSFVLRCKEWVDFQGLAMQAQMLTFSFKEDEKVFQVDALKENKIVTYKMAFPEFSIILKTMLSGLLDIKEQNIIEGFLDKPK